MGNFLNKRGVGYLIGLIKEAMADIAGKFKPVVFKGTLGVGGTITSLPAASSDNEGFEYKVITAGTYDSQSADVGDVFISNGSAWVLIPSGDDEEVVNQVSVTYSELKTLRDGGNLVAGTWYRITDYVTTTIQENTQSAGHQFDIIVRADDESHLNENAYATHHEGDTYFQNSKLESWQLKYCLDNDTNRFAWANNYPTHIIKSDITTEFSNTNDWLQRWPNMDGQNPGTDPQLVDWKFAWGTEEDNNNGDPECFIYTVGSTPPLYSDVMRLEEWGQVTASQGVGKGVIYHMKDEFGNECPYDFKNIQFRFTYAISKSGIVANVYYYTFSVATGTNDATVTDHSLNGRYCYGNKIGQHNSNNKSLNFNIFRNTSPTVNCYSNIFGDGCFANTFGNGCSSNTFWYGCFSNTFGHYCFFNTFGYGCYYNTFGNYCYYNTFGNECNYIQFSRDFTYHCIVENGGQSAITLTSIQTTSPTNKLQNITIAPGISNKTISHNTVNDTFKTTYQPANSQVISV